MKKITQALVAIDPDDCGSIVSGYVQRLTLPRGSQWIEGNGKVVLTDCNRSVQWDLGGGHGGYRLAKIDRAIRALWKLRQAAAKYNTELSALRGRAAKQRALDLAKRRKTRKVVPTTQ